MHSRGMKLTDSEQINEIIRGIATKMDLHQNGCLYLNELVSPLFRMR